MKRNLSMLMDFYELTMANGYFDAGFEEKEAVYDLYFRDIPDSGGFAVFAGLEQVVEILENLHFSEEDITYLKGKKLFSERFLAYLRTFTFTASVYAMQEGTPVFPNEPLLIVKGKLIEAQLIETILLLSINYPTLIATKASRITMAAKGRAVMEFGARRAHSYDASIYGARAAVIAGCVGTSNTLADQLYGVNALGTMAHSYVQSFPSEYEAFKAYATTYPNDTVLLVDTYSTLKSGLPNAIRVHKEVLEPRGYRLKAIRIDSGDLAYLSKEARKMLDQASMHSTKIIASNALNEFLIQDLITQGACIDTFGVGENLITAKSDAVLGGVYKLAAITENNTLTPKIKLSDNVVKTTVPGFKQVYRFYDKTTHNAIADVITLHDEVINADEPYLLFDMHFPQKQKWVTDFYACPLLVKIFDQGKRVYDLPSTEHIKQYHKQQMNTLWDELKRLNKPHQYYVDLSLPLWTLRDKLMRDKR